MTPVDCFLKNDLIFDVGNMKFIQPILIAIISGSWSSILGSNKT